LTYNIQKSIISTHFFIVDINIVVSKEISYIDFIKAHTVAYDNRARMLGTYPISLKIFDKHVRRARESAVSSIGATLGFRMEARRFRRA